MSHDLTAADTDELFAIMNGYAAAGEAEAPSPKPAARKKAGLQIVVFQATGTSRRVSGGSFSKDPALLGVRDQQRIDAALALQNFFRTDGDAEANYAERQAAHAEAVAGLFPDEKPHNPGAPHQKPRDPASDLG